MPPQQALRHFDKAFRNFFEGRAKYPTFKKKHGRQSAEYTTSAFRWDGEHVTLAKMERPGHPLESPVAKDAKPTTVTVTQDTAGRYFVSFLVEEAFEAACPSSPQPSALIWACTIRWRSAPGKRSPIRSSFASGLKAA